MATLGANVLTLTDWAKRLDPDGKHAVIAEMLSQTNEVMEDALFREGNLPTGHRASVRTGLPDVYWRLLNQGVTPSKSSTAQVDESLGILEAWSEVDVDLADLNGNTKEFRLSEARSFLEAMSIEASSTFFYGNSSTAPEEFNGLAVRYSSLSAANAENIVSGGGSGSDNASIWLVGWGENATFCIFPKGSKAGIHHSDLGKGVVESTAGIAGSRLEAYRDKFQLKMGVVVKDWRYTVRIPNIDISNLVANSSAADIIELMIKATHRVYNLKAVKPMFYMNRTIFQFLDIHARNDLISGGGIKFDMIEGKPLYSFRGIPIRICDALTNSESTIS